MHVSLFNHMGRGGVIRKDTKEGGFLYVCTVVGNGVATYRGYTHRQYTSWQRAPSSSARTFRTFHSQFDYIHAKTTTEPAAVPAATAPRPYGCARAPTVLIETQVMGELSAFSGVHRATTSPVE